MSSTSSFFPSLRGFTSFTLRLYLHFMIPSKILIFCLPHNLSLSSQFSPGSTLCLGLQPEYESFKKIVGHLGFRLMFHVDPDLFLLLKVIEHFWQILRDSLRLCYRLFQAGKFPTQIQKNIFRITFPSSWAWSFAWGPAPPTPWHQLQLCLSPSNRA